MDILTHGLIGGALAQSLAKKHRLLVASLAGFVGGILADIDILVRSSEDPLLNLEVHRALTHWLVFIPVGGLVAALILWPLLRRTLPFRKLALFTTAGYATHALLDACTSYGTQLFGPFSGNPVAWNLISVVDPVATLLLMAGFGIALTRRQAGAARVGVALMLTYLTVGGLQHERVRAQVQSIAAGQGHQPERLVVKPTLGNLVLWRTLYEFDGHYYINAIRAGFGTDAIPGDRTPVLDYQSAFAPLETDSRLFQDIERFHRFASGYLVWHPEQPGVIGDVRYAMLPHEVAPIWGIRLPANWRTAEGTVSFEHFRRTDVETRQAFLDMVLGRIQ
ncbi:metal-dependent hydrolase [Saccharospirillum impatiens]|uniref:metal-dependent hydrolase n=1 Tax=Saccharospirillum impatiens TaxID=169438 RepID=UPI00042048DF|nr:metal-dependent hydrolase [Saccharospirillum impatiens]